MAMIKGITVILIDRIQVGMDGFRHPVYEEREIEVENVLVAPAASTDIPETLDLERKKITYTLAIPKGDTHEWADHEVKFFGKKWKVCQEPLGGIESLLPLDWNKKVVVERYE